MRKLSILALIILISVSCSQRPEPLPGPHSEQMAEFGEKPFHKEPVKVLTGLDVLEGMGFQPLAGKRVGIVTNHTAVNRQGQHLVDLLHASPEVEVGAIFGPEHGFRGHVEGGFDIETVTDSLTGAPIYSIYGSTRKPTPEMVAGLDFLVFDIQDVGARFYTYISTMGYVMEAAGEYGLPLMILDRPNPVSGVARGPILNMEHQSFVGMYPIPIQHGLTVAELAKMIQGEAWMPHMDSLDLHIVPMEGWTRDLFWQDTDLEWIDPSPNMRNPLEAITYPGLCLLEGTNLNEGRGTVMPFEQIGAPWMDSKSVARQLLESSVAGFTVEPVVYTPVSMPGYSLHPRFMGEEVNGILIRVPEPQLFDAVAFGVHYLTIMHTDYPEQFEWRSPASIDRFWGSSSLREQLAEGKTADEIIASYGAELDAFNNLRTPYLIY